MTHKKTSVITVNFNCGPLLTDCVRSVLASTVCVEVFVSDNGSTDGSIQHLKREIKDDRLKIIMNGENLGFAKASNIPLPKAKGEVILFLNPDCTVFPDTLEKMQNAVAEGTAIGMASCLLLNADGTEQAGCRRRVPTPARTLIRTLHLDKPFPFLHEKGMLLHTQALPEKPVEVEAISGAFMMVSREALEDVGPLDEGYFLHCEDLDWCMQFRIKGWKILFVPDARAVHYQGTCGRSRPIFVEWHKHKGMMRFYRKFFRHQYPWVLMWLVALGVWLRFWVLAMQCTARRFARWWGFGRG